jgi:cell wall-associated NlpC family hydrolase
MHLEKYWLKDFLHGITILCGATILLSSCSSTLKTTSSVPPHSAVKPQASSPSPTPVHKQEVVLKKPSLLAPDTTLSAPASPIEKRYSAIQLQFAEQIGISPEQVASDSLYSFISEWLNTPYKYAGKSKSGIDCSYFTCTLYKDVFNDTISGSSKTLLQNSKPVKKENLTEGDLVFFKIKKGRVSHVGVYLANNKFVHASVKLGVTISDLNNDYYKKRFFRGGRMKT